MLYNVRNEKDMLELISFIVNNNIIVRCMRFFSSSEYDSSQYSLSYNGQKYIDDLCCYVYGSIVISHILARNPQFFSSHIESLYLYMSIVRTPYSEDGLSLAREVFHPLVKNPLLEVVYIRNTKVCTETARIISDVIRKNKHINIVSLISCGLDEHSIKLVSNAVVENKNIVKLNIYFNSISSIGAMYIARAVIASKKLSHLSLRHNNFGDIGAVEIARAISYCTSIKVLDLSYNKIKDKGVRAIISSLEFDNSLIYFSIYGNNHVRDLEDVARFIKMNNTVKYMSIWGDKSTWDIHNEVYILKVIKAIEKSRVGIEFMRGFGSPYLEASKRPMKKEIADKLRRALQQSMKNQKEYERLSLCSGSQLILKGPCSINIQTETSSSSMRCANDWHREGTITPDIFLSYVYNYYIRLVRLFNRLEFWLDPKDLQRIYWMAPDRELKIAIGDNFGCDVFFYSWPFVEKIKECKDKSREHIEHAALDSQLLKSRCLKIAGNNQEKFTTKLFELSLDLHIRVQQCLTRQDAGRAIALFVNKLLSIIKNIDSFSYIENCFDLCTLNDTKFKLSTLLGKKLSVSKVLKKSYYSISRKKFSNGELSAHSTLIAYNGGVSDAEDTSTGQGHEIANDFSISTIRKHNFS